VDLEVLGVLFEMWVAKIGNFNIKSTD